MGVLNEAAQAAVTGGHLAHLTTVGADGGPQVSVVWVGLDGGELVTGHLGAYQKVRNVRRDGRVSVAVVTGRKDPSGLDEYLVVYGTARVQDGGAPELLQELAYRYVGPGVKFPPMPDPPAGYVLRITPERVAGVGPWKEPAGG